MLAEVRGEDVVAGGGDGCRSKVFACLLLSVGALRRLKHGELERIGPESAMPMLDVNRLSEPGVVNMDDTSVSSSAGSTASNPLHVAVEPNQLGAEEDDEAKMRLK